MTINMFNGSLVAALLAVVMAGCAAQTDSMQRAAAQISEPVYRQLVAELASDAFEGRAPGSPGEVRTVEFLEREFQELGLRPANGASFRQEVPLVEITAIPANASLGFTVAGQRLELALADDMVIGTRRVQAASSVADSDVVFVGYGIVAPEYGWNDYEGLDMRGKTALILVNDPGFASEDPALFRGRTMTYYGRWTYKFEEAARQGAAAAIIIHDTAPAAYPWAVVRNGWTGPQFYLERADGNAGRSAIEGWITLDRARQLLALAGQDLDALSLAARQRGFRPVPLAAKADAGVRNLIRRAKSPNVAAVMPGTTREDEYVIYVAHWDHLGRALALGGDTIFNGAQDNATGVAGILAIARAFRSLAPPPERSVLFLSVTAEESGLIGSEFYAANPLVPLEKTAAVINIDSLAPLGRARDLQVIGLGASELDDLLAEAAAGQGRVLTPDSSPEAGYFYRSDHVNLAKAGVPSLYVKSGTDLRGQAAGEGQRRVDAYFNDHYHKQSDDYREEWDVSGSIEDLTLLFQVGAGVAAGGTWPNWYPDNEFRAARDRSAAQRSP